MFRPPKLGRFMLSQDNKVESSLSSSLYQTMVQLPQESLMQSWIMCLENGVRKKPETRPQHCDRKGCEKRADH